MSYNIYDSVNKRLVNIAGSPSVFTGATASTDGTTGIVPAPAAGSQNKTLKADGTWGEGLAPTEIAYEDWMELTPEERNAGQWLVTDFPQSMNASLIPYTGDVSAANVGDAIDTLNQNLTTRVPIWNPTDDWWYVNGEKYKYAGINSLVIYNYGEQNYTMQITSQLNMNGYSVGDAEMRFNTNDISLHPGNLSSSGNRNQIAVTDSVIPLSGKKIIVDYYLNGDRSNIRTATSTASDSDGYIVIYASRVNGACYFGVGKSNVRTGTFTFLIGAGSGIASGSDIVHIVKIYAE